MKYESTLTLNLKPDSFVSVKNQNTYLYINGVRSTAMFRVSRRTRDTIPHDNEPVAFEDPGLLVSFSKIDNLAKIQIKKPEKTKGESIIYICGKIILRINRRIDVAELLDKDGSRRGKDYPARLYPPNISSSSSSSSSSSMNTSALAQNTLSVAKGAEGIYHKSKEGTWN
eukprot:jgi/Bigna1/91771/estExt_fgenesh1_pg.C_1180011